jgi:hypothetical protein
LAAASFLRPQSYSIRPEIDIKCVLTGFHFQAEAALAGVEIFQVDFWKGLRLGKRLARVNLLNRLLHRGLVNADWNSPARKMLKAVAAISAGDCLNLNVLCWFLEQDDRLHNRFARRRDFALHAANGLAAAATRPNAKRPGDKDGGDSCPMRARI